MQHPDDRQSPETPDPAPPSDFLGGMSHQIRTPMSAVFGLSHLLLKTELTPRQRDYVVKIQSAGQQLLGIMDDIIDFSKAQAGTLELEPADFGVEKLLDMASSAIAADVGRKGLELVIDIDPSVPRTLTGDAARIARVLQNFAAHAVKTTDHGAITLGATRVCGSDSQALVRFEVRDTGAGLDQEQAQLMLEPGMGLAPSRKVAELMGGQAGVLSAPGRGSTWWFTVPLGVGRDRQLLVPTGLRGCRALVVDDSFDARAAIADMLQSLSFEVTEAASGCQAIDAVRSAAIEGRPFDIVYMDWRMPGMDGMDAASRIRSLGLEVPPLMMMVSAYSREDMVKQAQACGIDTVLAKPVRASTLYDATMDVLAKRRALPAVRRDIAEADGMPVPPACLASIRGARVLLVEDNDISQLVARELLEGSGLLVDVAENGQAALDMVQRTAYDLVFMDMQMPVMDGVAATRAIRRIPNLAALPIVAMTANAMEQDRQLCRAAGMNDSLIKPVEPRTLWATLLRWIPPVAGAAAASAVATTQAHAGHWLEGVPGLDAVQGLGLVGGNEALYRTRLARFTQVQGAAPAQVHEALANGDLAQAELLAHTVKAVAGQIGARQVQELARGLEQALRTCSPPLLVQDRLAQLERTMTALTGSLAAKLELESEPAA